MNGRTTTLSPVMSSTPSHNVTNLVLEDMSLEQFVKLHPSPLEQSPKAGE